MTDEARAEGRLPAVRTLQTAIESGGASCQPEAQADVLGAPDRVGDNKYTLEKDMARDRVIHDSAADGRLFLSATEVGRQLGLGKSRVYALAAEGLLPTVRLGRRMWFPTRGLEALANAVIERAEDRVAGSPHLWYPYAKSDYPVARKNLPFETHACHRRRCQCH